MRRKALASCLSLKARDGVIVGLEDYPNEIKTKKVTELLKKLPVEPGRSILFVVPERHDDLTWSVRNLQRVKTVQAAYLNPEDVLKSHHIIFIVDAIKKAEEIFAKSPKIPKLPKSKKSEKTSETPKK